ncbi:unnamed protein product, partial [Discosporangium mesarthrocarpum]
GLLLQAFAHVQRASSTSSGEGGVGAVRLGRQRRPSNILLAPGPGSGVGIGPAFSARDLGEQSSANLAVPNLVFITNSTRPSGQRLKPPPDSHLAVESSGDGSISILSPRGHTAALKMGC